MSVDLSSGFDRKDFLMSGLSKKDLLAAGCVPQRDLLDSAKQVTRRADE